MIVESPLHSIKTVIFDLDGTLSDPFSGITGCMAHALRTQGISPPPAAQLAQYIGPPLRETFRSLLGTSDPDRIESAVEHYRDRYAHTGLFENELYPGIPRLLRSLKQRGFELFVATSKLRVLAQRIAEHFEIADYFDGIYGAEAGGRFDDKRELLPHLVTTEGRVGYECVMVGDRRYDVEAGKVIGCSTVGVTYGYGSRGELTAAAADFLCGSPEEVAAIPLLRRIA